MSNLSKQETRIVYNHLNKFLKNFEINQLEKEFWNDTYKVQDLIEIKNKLKTSLENDA
tara:strand:- start:95 stop:268 length:174 start_codon:yes stop_codon:yes gene_type:complete